MRILKSHPILTIINGMLIDLPAPSNITYWWGFGSLLGLCLIIQIATGIFIAMHYSPTVDSAFISVEHIMRDVNYGWFLRYTHSNGASMFFIMVYLHVARGLYFGSYTKPREMLWGVGVVILIVMMATAFIGYNGRKWYNFMSNLLTRSIEDNSGQLGHSTESKSESKSESEPSSTNNNNKEVKEKILKNAKKIYKDLHLIETQIKIREENKHKAGIYILFNKINDKFYVGSAITNRINTRFRNHCFHGAGSPITKRAINHHGIENFYFIIYEYFPGIILKDNLKTENLKLLTRESEIINELNPEYNILKIAGNSIGYKHTDETKKKMKENFSEIRKNRIKNLNLNKNLSDVIRDKMSESKIEFYKKNPEFKEFLKKLSSKPVILYDLKTGGEIMSFSSIRTLSKYLGCCNKTINKALKNNTPIKNQYKVKFLEKDHKIES